MSDLYETDVLEWSEQQADLLRRQAAGEKLNEAPDWTNIIEEIECVGRSEFRAVRSLLVQAMAHRLKVLAWPDSRDLPAWRAEIRVFLSDAADEITPSMRQKLDLPKLYAKALLAIPESVDGIPPLALPPVCPWTLDELLGD